MELTENFSQLSIDITKSLTQKEKKKDGIFFTPKTMRNLVFNGKGMCKKIKNHNKLENRKRELTVLEPSAGGCGFIDDVLDKIKNIKVTGIELNEKIWDNIKNKYDNNNNVDLINGDFLTHNFGKQKFDYIPGNPPYFIIKKEMKNIYNIDNNIFSGKINIFCLFIHKSLQLLKNNGILSFVIPTTILNTYSYDKFRRYINDNFKIVDILPLKDCGDFLDTKQDTLILTLQKCKKFNNNNFIFEHNDYLFFTYEKEYYINFLKNKTFIKDLDITVKTGTIAWNQHKEKLTTDKNKRLLIYDFNITKESNKLKLYEEEGIYNKKGQYIDIDCEDKLFEAPALLIVRGNGNGELQVKCTKVSSDFKYKKFYAENHIYVIQSKDEELLDNIFNTLKKEETINFLKKSIPNKCLTKTDIMNIIPLNMDN